MDLRGHRGSAWDLLKANQEKKLWNAALCKAEGGGWAKNSLNQFETIN